MHVGLALEQFANLKRVADGDGVADEQDAGQAGHVLDRRTAGFFVLSESAMVSPSFIGRLGVLAAASAFASNGASSGCCSRTACRVASSYSFVALRNATATLLLRSAGNRRPVGLIEFSRGVEPGGGRFHLR